MDVMKIFAILGLVIALLASAGESGKEEVIDVSRYEDEDRDASGYVSVCERCRELAATYRGFTPAALNKLKPKLFKECDGMGKLLDECKLAAEFTFIKLLEFFEELATSPEKAEEICNLLRCDNEIYEIFNRDIFERKSNGMQDFLCWECQRMMSSEILFQALEDYAVRSNLNQLVVKKICPAGTSDNECLRILIFPLKILMKWMKLTFADDLEVCFPRKDAAHFKKCKLAGACDWSMKSEEAHKKRKADEL